MNKFHMIDVATKTAVFLSSVGIHDEYLLHKIVFDITGYEITTVMTDTEIKTLMFLENPKDGYVRRYTTAELGCSLRLSKKKVEQLLFKAGLIELVNDELLLTRAGSVYGIKENGKLFWYSSVNKLLRKLDRPIFSV